MDWAQDERRQQLYNQAWHDMDGIIQGKDQELCQDLHGEESYPKSSQRCEQEFEMKRAGETWKTMERLSRRNMRGGYFFMVTFHSEINRQKENETPYLVKTVGFLILS